MNLVSPGEDKAQRYPSLSHNVPEGTFYQVRKGKLVGMVTITPKGLHGGWDTCAGCLRHVRTCECERGIVAPHSVRHVYEKDGGVLPEEPARERTMLPPRLALGLPEKTVPVITPLTRVKKRRILFVEETVVLLRRNRKK